MSSISPGSGMTHVLQDHVLLLSVSYPSVLSSSDGDDSDDEDDCDADDDDDEKDDDDDDEKDDDEDDLSFLSDLTCFM